MQLYFLLITSLGGYTPLESVAFGVPTITTTLSGFGQWILSSFENDFNDYGVNVIARGDYNYNEVADGIANALYTLAGNVEQTASKSAKRQ